MDVRAALARLVGGGSLDEGEMEGVVGCIMDGQATPAQIGGLLVALRLKGETVAEVTGAVRAMRAHAVALRPKARVIVDTCGTGGDGKGTFNVSTAAALVAAGAGVTVAKHGNRAMSGAVGAADVLEALGVRLDVDPSTVARCIDEVGIGFLFAQAFHPAMRHVAGPRRELGVRTIFNVLGPLSNPAGATHQVVGVFAREWLQPLAESLRRLGSVRALIVHADDGMDEISLCAPTAVVELRDGKIRADTLAPEQFSLQRCRPDTLLVHDRAGAVRALEEVLNGTAGPRLDMTLVNAAAAIYVAGVVPSIAAGIEKARDAVRSGRAREKLSQLVRLTNE